MAGSPTISVVIPHLNQVDAAQRCLASLEAQTYPLDRVQIILVDNGSTASLEPLAERHPTVLILHEPQPGPGNARNRGVAAATGDVLVFIDADCRAHPNWLQEAVDGLAVDGSTGVVGGDVRIDYLDPSRLTPLEAYESVFAYRQKLYIEQRGFSGTGNLAVRRAIFDQVGPFGGIDVAEDTDWGQRAKGKGHPARYRAGMIVYHPARTSFAELAAKWRRHVAHDLEHHRRRGKTPTTWRLRAFAVMLSAVPHANKILLSGRLSSLSSRLAGIGILFRIRWYRFRQMMTQIDEGGHNAAGEWNRNTN